MSSLKDFYDAKTRGGYDWGYSADEEFTVTGYVVVNNAQIPVTWLRDFNDNQNLFSQHGRAYDVHRRYVVETPMETQSIERLMDTPFIVHPTRNAYVTYSMSLPVHLLLLGTDTATVTLLVDDVPVASVTNSISILAGLFVDNEADSVKPLSGVVAAGQTVTIRTDVVSNTAPAPSILDQNEVLLGGPLGGESELGQSHNSLSGIQGGAPGDYNHITSQQLNTLNSSEVLTWLSM